MWFRQLRFNIIFNTILFFYTKSRYQFIIVLLSLGKFSGTVESEEKWVHSEEYRMEVSYP